MLEDEQAKTQEALSGTPKPLSQMNSKDMYLEPERLN